MVSFPMVTRMMLSPETNFGRFTVRFPVRVPLNSIDAFLLPLLEKTSTHPFVFSKAGKMTSSPPARTNLN